MTELEISSLSPIAEMPAFNSRVPEIARQRMQDKGDEDALFIADTSSIMDQRTDWIVRHIVISHNLSIANTRQIRTWKNKIESPLTYLAALGAFIASTGLGAMISNLFRH